MEKDPQLDALRTVADLLELEGASLKGITYEQAAKISRAARSLREYADALEDLGELAGLLNGKTPSE